MPYQFVCPACGKGSAHPDDRRAGWCSACQGFTGDPEPDEHYAQVAARREVECEPEAGEGAPCRLGTRGCAARHARR